MNVHAKSCLGLESLRTLQLEDKGQPEACPDHPLHAPGGHSGRR
jgi:hypothetical protein